jgi:surface antigen
MHLRFATLVLSALVSSVVLNGCSTRGTNGARTGMFFGRTAPGADYISALQGGIIGRIPVKISSGDRQRALEAEYRALEQAAVGQPVPWTGGNARGQVVAAAPYQVGSQNCRQYTHTIFVDGREAKERGAACRNDDGTWTPLT